MTERSGIYAIKNRLSGKVYVGSAMNISKRWSRHKKDLVEKKHLNTHLQAAVNKYGLASFAFIVLELTTDLIVREQYWIDVFDSYKRGYNLCPIARSSRGRRWSNKERERRLPLAKRFNERVQSPEAKFSRTAKRRFDRTLGQKITFSIATQIREEYASGTVTYGWLAGKYGISPVTVFDVVKFKTWRTDPNENLPN